MVILAAGIVAGGFFLVLMIRKLKQNVIDMMKYLVRFRRYSRYYT
jgi:hypothetical protein